MNTLIAPDEQSNCYDNTKLSTYKTCPRLYLLRQVMGWKRTGTAPALVFGKGWHAGQDAIWEHAKKHNPANLAQLAQLKFLEAWQEDGFNPDPGLNELNELAPRTPPIAHEMFYNYINARWRMLQECEVLAIEQPFAVPLPSLTNVYYVGRLDKVIDYNGQRLIPEHKTTTAYATIGNFRTDFVDSWYNDSQVKGYQFGGALTYGNIDGVWIDAALVHKKIHDAFKLIPVHHSTPLLVEWVGDATQWAIRVMMEEKKFAQLGHLEPGDFPKNENSCFGKYGACPMIDVCRSVADPTTLDGPPPGYVVEFWNPFDVLKLDKIIHEPGE